MKRTSAELKRQARGILTHRYGVPMAVMVVSELIVTALLFPFSWNITEQSSVRELVIYYIANFVISLINVVLSIGRIYISLMMARGKKYSFRDLFYGFSHHPDKYILATLLLTLIMMIPMIPFVLALPYYFYSAGSVEALVLLIVAVLVMIVGEMYLSLRYALNLYLLLDYPDMRVTESFRESSERMKGNKGRLLYISLSFIGWELLGMLSFGIGLLWIMPYMVQTRTNFYLDVEEERKPVKTYTHEWRVGAEELENE